jgi:hypothetical protein
VIRKSQKAEKCRWPVDARKDREINSPLKVSRRNLLF